MSSTKIYINLHRFTVSNVENEKSNGIHMGASIISRPLRSSVESAVAGAPAPGAQPDTWLHDAGWRRKRSLAQLTREALPRMENYRNSKRALKRPSLGELHGDHLITEEVMFLNHKIAKLINPWVLFNFWIIPNVVRILNSV